MDEPAGSGVPLPPAEEPFPALDGLSDVVRPGNGGVSLDDVPDLRVDDIGAPADFVPPPLKARHVYLRPITPGDYPYLQMLETTGDLAPRWRHRGVTPSPDQWAQTLWASVLAQFMVVGVETNKPIGRVMVYQPNFQDRWAYFAAMRFEPRERSPTMILGISLFLRYVFGHWDFDKLYMEVPEYNFAQFSSGLDRFFVMEGRLRNHFRLGARSWDQLILAVYRDTASREGSRLRLDLGERSVIAPAGPPPDGGTSQESVPGPMRATILWEEFVAELSVIAGVPAEQVTPDSRVLEDLGLDSLALAELGVVMVDRYDTWSLSKDMETRSWANLTARELYDEYLSGAPPSKTPAKSD